LKAAGTIVLISAILSIFIGFVSIGLSQTYVEVDSYSGVGSYHESRSYQFSTEKIIAGIFGLFGFIFGIISSVLIFTRKLFSLTIIGQGILFTAAAFTAVVGIIPYLLLGLPILIIGTISMVFTVISRKDFLL